MEITVDTSGLLSYLDDFEQRQVPFAMANTLNDVAKLFQYRQREHDHSIFTVRRQPWVDQSVKITQFAKKSALTASVEIQSPGGGDRSDILAKFETQTSKTPRGQSIAVPVDAKRNKLDIIPQSARPKAFHFHQVGGASLAKHTARLSSRKLKGGVLRGALQVFEGDKGTVMIRNAQGKGVILQRVGSGKKAGMRVLYYLTPRVHLTPNLAFVETALEAAQHVSDFFAARFREAMSTAR